VTVYNSTCIFIAKVDVSLLSRDEYDFLPINGSLQNKNPVIIEGHKVALELWAVKILYLYAHSRLVGCTFKETGRKALGKVSRYF